MLLYNLDVTEQAKWESHVVYYTGEINTEAHTQTHNHLRDTIMCLHNSAGERQKEQCHVISCYITMHRLSRQYTSKQE